MKDTFRLSKSKYCSGVQCPKMLWLMKNKPEAFDDSVINQGVLDTGNEVGDLAMGLLGDFTEVPFDSDLTKMILKTEELLEQGVKVIAEASFLFEGLFCSVDILKNKGERHVEVYEVKSATEVHTQYEDDIAYQVYVLRRNGFIVDKAFLVHINNQYVRHGDLDLKQLFVINDLTEIANLKQEEVEKRIQKLQEYMSHSEEPEDGIGPRCFDPYDCGFWNYCTACLPKPNVFDLARVQTRTKLACLYQGLVSFEAVLDQGNVNEKAKQQIRHELYDLPPEVDKKAIKKHLDTLTYPMYFLDFESFSPAIPMYDDSKPYQQICFQYSLHYIEEENAEDRLATLRHKEFLAYPGKDPRRELCEQLCRDIPKDSCVVAYNITFEKTRLKEMAELYPDLSEHLLNIANNLRDQMVPFRERKYYCRAMKGSYSIKQVLPALLPDDPELDYHSLDEVHNGTEASEMFKSMAAMDPMDLEKSRKNLLAYCGLDTFAMVRIWEKLIEVAE